MMGRPLVGSGGATRRFAACVLGALLLAATFSAKPGAAVERPTYTTGDFWRYRSNLTEAFGLRFEGNTSAEALDVVDTRIQGQVVESLAVFLTGGGAFSGSIEGLGDVNGTWDITGSENWETANWKSVRSTFRLSARGTLGLLRFTLSVVNETTRLLRADGFPFPIEAGSQGTVLAHWNASQNITFQFTDERPIWNESTVEGDFATRYAHTGTERVTVPAGTFDADVIREEGPEGGHRIRWYASRVGNDVRQEEYNSTGGRVATAELTAYRYRAGEPAPPTPWLLYLVAALAAVVVVLGLALARRRRKPEPVWMPPEKEDLAGKPPSP